MRNKRSISYQEQFHVPLSLEREDKRQKHELLINLFFPSDNAIVVSCFSVDIPSYCCALQNNRGSCRNEMSHKQHLTWGMQGRADDITLSQLPKSVTESCLFT